MEMQLIFLIVIHLTSTMTRFVSPGETVIMGCSVTHNNLTMWYGQHSYMSPFVVIEAKLNKGGTKDILKRFYHGSNDGFIFTLEHNNNSISLTISNMTESLLGFYYCASGTGKITFGSVYVLEYEKQDVSSTCPPKSSTDPPESSKCPPESARQCWVLMAILCSLSAGLATLSAFIVNWIFHRKGNAESESTKPDQKQSNNMQEVEDGVLYSRLHFSDGGRRGNGKITHN